MNKVEKKRQREQHVVEEMIQLYGGDCTANPAHGSILYGNVILFCQ